MGKLQQIEREYYGTSDIGKMMGVTPRTVRRWIEHDGLPAEIFKGDYYIKVSDWEEFRKRKMVSVNQGA